MKKFIPSDYPAIKADVEDAIEDGVVVIGANLEIKIS